MILTIDPCYDILDRLVEEYPEELFRDLNGGILLLEEELADPEAGEDVYIMGEYCWDEMGRYINLYYGSFAALAEREEWDDAVWEDELAITLSHELTHHMENRGGLHALDDRDAEELALWRQEFQARETEEAPESQV